MRLRRKTPVVPYHCCPYPAAPVELSVFHCKCGKSWLYMGDGRWRDVSMMSFGTWWAAEIARNPNAEPPAPHQEPHQ